MLIYRLLLGLLTPLILAHVLWRSFRDGGPLYLKQRLGFSLPTCSNCLWFHAASVGEVNTAVPLIQVLEQRHPALTILVTTNTPTGFKALQRRISARVQVSYLPLDFRFSIKRFYNHNKPLAGIILETEIWPNLYELAECELAIVNGRLSQRSLRAAEGRAAHLYQITLSRLSLVLTRSQADAEAFVRIGVDPVAVEVTGNLKFAQNRSTSGEADLMPFVSQSYCLLASTHDDEELQLAREWQRRNRNELLVIAPRHAERGAAVLRQLKPLTEQIAVRSRGETITPDTQIYIADTYGEMQHWYLHANAIFMGGSLIPRGGHNMLEPAAHGQSVVSGEYTFNFSDEVESLQKENAIATATSCEAIIDQLIVLLDEPELANNRGIRARNLLNRHADIALSYAERLENWLDL